MINGYGAMVAVMLATAIVLITAIILAALSLQYIIDGLQALSVIQISG